MSTLALPHPHPQALASPAAWPARRRRRGGLALVVAAHAAALLALWHARARLPPEAPPPALTVQVVRAGAAPVDPSPARPLPVPAPRPAPVVAVPVPSIVLPMADPAPQPPSPTRPPGPALPAPAVVTAATATPALAPSPPPPAPAMPRTLPPGAVAYLQPPPIELPLASRRLGEQGTVWLRVRVGADGLPREVTLHRSSGHARLDEQAVWAMQRARFRPHTENGQPIEWIVIAPLQYEIE